MTHPSDAAAGIPAALHAMLPEAGDARWAGEPRADCGRCPMLEAHGEHAAHAFASDLRCCTYHPSLPSFLAGAALQRGGTSAERVRARLADPSNVDGWGIRPSDAWATTYVRLRDHGFARAPALRCPFWVGGELACGIWHERTSTCRTWFCKHEDGLPGARAWDALRDALRAAEDALARWLVAHRADDALAAGDWPTWYRRCADHARALDPGELARIAEDDAPLRTARAALAPDALPAPESMPEILVPNVGTIDRSGGTVRLSGYSSYDGVVAPAHVFAFLAALDGETPWRAACRAAGLDEAIARDLYRAGAIAPPRNPTPHTSLPMID